jgi:hypothetical protein
MIYDTFRADLLPRSIAQAMEYIDAHELVMRFNGGQNAISKTCCYVMLLWYPFNTPASAVALGVVAFMVSAQ